jgi:hypothetical protein
MMSTTHVAAVDEVSRLDRDAEAGQLPPQELISRYRALALKFASMVDDAEEVDPAEQRSPFDREVAVAKRMLRRPIGLLIGKGMPPKIARGFVEASVNNIAVTVFMRWKVFIGDRAVTAVWYAIPEHSTGATIACGFAIGHEWPSEIIECRQHKGVQFNEVLANEDISILINRAEKHP